MELEVLLHFHKNLLLKPVISQLNPVHTLTNYVFMIQHFILLAMPPE